MGWKGKGAGVDGIIFSIVVACWSVGGGGRVGRERLRNITFITATRGHVTTYFVMLV